MGSFLSRLILPGLLVSPLQLPSSSLGVGAESKSLRYLAVRIWDLACHSSPVLGDDLVEVDGSEGEFSYKLTWLYLSCEPYEAEVAQS